jgi:DNA-binding transcriptional ArsR family regulator
MAVRIPLSTERLGRSRFAISPAMEVVTGLLGRADRHAPPHVRRRADRARRRLRRDRLDLLCALIPTDHPHTPDFLTPNPAGLAGTIEGAAAAVAATPAEVVDRHLDVGFRGRGMPPDLVESFGGADALERWRRPVPPPVERALRQGGPSELARRAADALAACFDVALAPEWDDVRRVLEDDIAHRAERMATRGTIALLDDLGDGVAWVDGEVRLDRPFDVVVDWADDGLVLVPATAHQRRVLLCAEPPDTPLLSYRPRAVARLWGPPDGRDPARARAAVGELIGQTRAMLVAALDRPASTLQLSRRSGLAPATVSYHLGVLHRSGLVDRRRRGRTVLYARTSVGDELLHGP